MSEWYLVGQDGESLNVSGPFTKDQAWGEFAADPRSEVADVVVVRAGSPTKAISVVRPLFGF